MTSLVKKIDATSQKSGIKSFVTFLSDDEKLEDQLKKLADKEGLEKTVLSIDNVAGPEGYSIAKDADVTVLTYNKRKVLANHALRKGELNEAAIERIMDDVAKLAAASKKKKTDDE